MFLTRLLALALVTIATLAHAEPYLVHKNGAVVYDQATRLVWMRCSLGQIWNGKTCEGSGGKFNFGEAQQTANGFGGYGGYNDWRVPTVRELHSLLSCPKYGQYVIEDGVNQTISGCADRSPSPTIGQSAFPKTPDDWFWSSSPYVGSAAMYRAFRVDFSDGDVRAHYGNHGSKSYVRLVRANQLSGDVAAMDFVTLEADRLRILAAENAEAERLAAKEKADGERRDVEQKKAEVERKRAEATRVVTLKKLVAGGAQSLYLQAGKAQRNGSVDVSGVNFYASELYELLIEKFPNSDYAVKATDQLTAMGRSERQAGAVRDAANTTASAQRDADRNSSNRASCFSEVRSCEAGCSRNDTVGSRNYCIRGCQRTCN